MKRNVMYSGTIAIVCYAVMAMTVRYACAEKPLEARCVIIGAATSRGLYYIGEKQNVVVRCMPRNQSHIEKYENILNQGEGTMRVAVRNSTFSKIYTTSWITANFTSNVTVEYAELFYDDMDSLEPADLQNNTLIWQTDVELCHEGLPSCILKPFVLAYSKNEYENIINLDADQSQNASGFFQDGVTQVKLPCNDVAVLFLSINSSRKSVSLALKTSSSAHFLQWKFYTVKMKFASENLLDNTTIYQAALLHDELLLLTSDEMIVSTNLKQCWGNRSADCGTVYFSTIKRPDTPFDINWEDSELFYDLKCLSLSYGKTESALQSRVYLKVCGYEGVIFYSSTLSDLRFARDEKISLNWIQNTSTCAVNHVTYLQPSHIFLIHNSVMWWSFDGGLLFTRMWQLSANQSVVSVAQYHRSMKIAFLLNDSMIFVVQAGKSPRLFQSFLERSNISSLEYDEFGHLFALQSGRMVDLSHLEHPDHYSICTMSLIPGDWSRVNSVVYLDVGEEIEISATGISNFSVEESLLTVTLANAQLLKPIVTNVKPSVFSERISVLIQNMGNVQSDGSVSFMLVNAGPSCSFTAYTVRIRFSCPPGRKMVFDYSSLVGAKNVLPLEVFADTSKEAPMTKLLEKNYFPPSHLGISIPTSRNIYNYDPEIDPSDWILDYGISDQHKLIKASDVECSPAMKFSSFEKYAACKQRVYEVKFGVEYGIRLNFSRSNGIRQIFNENEYLISLEEVNGRSTDVYSIVEYSQTICSEDSANDICHGYQSGADPAYAQIHDDGRVLLNSTGLHIRFSGTGLFHFRITVPEVYSFCKLTDEFQVYVVNPPLPFPVGIVIRLTVSFVIGLALIFIYIKSLPGRSAGYGKSKRIRDSMNVRGPTDKYPSLLKRQDIQQEMRKSMQTSVGKRWRTGYV